MKNHLSLAAVAVTMLAAPVRAETPAWDFAATLYLWGSATEVTVATPSGSVSGELSFSDALEALDFAFMGTISAQRDKLSLALDALYFDLSDDRAVPNGPGFISAELKSRIKVVNAYALWEVAKSPQGRLDIGAGLRFFSLDNQASLSGPASVSFGLSDNWVDPLLALRYRAEFGSDWYGLLFADVGIGGESESTWQGVAALGYRFSDRFSVEGGYRVLQAERVEGVNTMDLEMSGPILGATWRF
ncbi:MAG: hypothetical protein ACRC14_16360 [Paracoccaceae bacterium]